MKKSFILAVANAILISTGAQAWPDQKDFGPHCPPGSNAPRGYAFLWHATAEGKRDTEEESIGLKNGQDVLFISDMGRYRDPTDWKIKPEFGVRVTAEYGVDLPGANYVCLENKDDAEEYRAAFLAYYGTLEGNAFGSKRSYEPVVIDVDMDWPLEVKD